MNTIDEDSYRCKEHERRIVALEEGFKGLHDSNMRIELEVREIKKKLENGISVKIEKITEDMAKVVPYIKNKMEFEKSIQVIALSIVISGIVALVVFLMKLYFNHG